jgi:O-antigen/teichoic acid export membrane protein
MRIPPLYDLDQHMREVLRGASTAFVMKAFGAGLEFGFNLLLARMLGAEGVGIFFLALTASSIATVFGRMGLDNTLVRFVAGNAAAGDWGAVRGVYRKAMLFAASASVASSVVLFAISPWLADSLFHKPELIYPMRCMAIAVVPVTLLILHSEALKGLKRVFAATLVQFQGVGFSALSLVGLYLAGRIWGVLGAVWAYTLAAMVIALLGFFLWLAATPQLRETTGFFPTRELLHSSLPLFWVASMNLVMQWTSSITLGIFGTTADVGIFNAASRTALLTSFILIAVNTIAAPKFAELYRQRDLAALGSTARNCARLMTLLALPVLLFFSFCPRWVMGWFGPEFVGGASALMILATGQFVSVAAGSVGYLLMMSGHERHMRNNVTLAAVVNVISNLILVPAAGVLGAALAKTITVVTFNLVAVYLVWLTLRIQTIPLDFIRLRSSRSGEKGPTR